MLGRYDPVPKEPFGFPHEPHPFGLPYTGPRMRWALEVVGWNINQFAHRMGFNEGTVRQMLTGRRHIPDPIGIWVETMAQLHLSLPKPLGLHEKRSYPQKTDDDLS